MPSLFPWFKKNATATRPQRNGDSIRTLPSTEFAFRLFENLNPGERNLAVCPYGARVLLSMLWEGSTGETRKEMSEALHFNMDPNSSGNCYERLGRPLGYQLKTERRGLQMLTANSLWCDDGFAPKGEYVKTLQEHYWAEIQTISFRAADAPQKVNRWADEKTHGRIPAVVSSLYEFSPLVALNAVYFKGSWVKPFESEQTKEEEFTLQNGKKELVPMAIRKVWLRGAARRSDCAFAIHWRHEHVRGPSAKRNELSKILRRIAQHDRHKLDRRNGRTARPSAASEISD